METWDMRQFIRWSGREKWHTNYCNTNLGGVNYLYFQPLPGEMDPIWRAYIFQNGWLNHQLSVSKSGGTPKTSIFGQFEKEVCKLQQKGKACNPTRDMWMFPKIMARPKSSILIEISITNHPFSGIPIFGNTQLVNIP